MFRGGKHEPDPYTCIFLIAAGVVLLVGYFFYPFTREETPEPEPAPQAQAPEPSENVLADTLESKLREPFEGDFDAIIERGFMRVLVPFSKTGYFIDKGAQRGSSYDLMTEFAKFLEKTHGRKMRDVKLVLIPTSRDNIFTDLSEHRGDLALGNLTITDKRLELASSLIPF